MLSIRYYKEFSRVIEYFGYISEECVIEPESRREGERMKDEGKKERGKKEKGTKREEGREERERKY